MKDKCNASIERTLELSREMLELANQGDGFREDIGCGVLFGTLRDCAYKLQSLAEAEISEHKLRNKWPEHIS